MKGLSIKYCINRAACRRFCWDLLVKLVNHLKARADSGMVSCVVPAELKKLGKAKAKDARVRAPWVEHGESSTTYFI